VKVGHGYLSAVHISVFFDLTKGITVGLIAFRYRMSVMNGFADLN
jgi:hypothetical protein